MPPQRRRATLLAFARAIEITATDEALDLLDLLITDIAHEAHKIGQKERLRTLRDLDRAALQLREACQILLDGGIENVQVRDQIFARISREQLLAATAQVEALARPPDAHYSPELIARHGRVRRFLPHLLQAMAFESTQAGQPILEALHFLTAIEGERTPEMNKAPLEWVLNP